MEHAKHKSLTRSDRKHDSQEAGGQPGRADVQAEVSTPSHRRRNLFRVTGAQVVPIPPPLYYGAALAGGLLLQRVIPLDVPIPSVTRPAGAVLLAAGLALNFAAVASVVIHKTTIVPHARVATLIRVGVYRLSRNPMYTGLGAAVAGASLIAHSWWPLILLPAALVAVRKLVIDPEERYLSQRFGSDYDSYRAQVPRWL
jgi:protein-S-isoprenylcysteine O-methyltransferase Ste14